MLHDLNTYLHKAIPDTKLTIRKYLDVKFEYLVRADPLFKMSTLVNYKQGLNCTEVFISNVLVIGVKVHSFCVPVLLSESEGDGR